MRPPTCCFYCWACYWLAEAETLQGPHVGQVAARRAATAESFEEFARARLHCQGQ